MNSLGGWINNRQMAQSLARRLQSLRMHNSGTTSTTLNTVPEIQVPLRKERSSTDILAALEKTISRDPTAAHYKYHDDPFFIPMSNVTKRTFALSKEAGRKAAMWIRQEHAYLFQHRIAVPEIPSFLPKAKYTKKDEVSEELLLNYIKQGSVTDALEIYKLLEGEISVETKQALLELFCYYNTEEQLPDDLIEERWYRKAATKQRQIWKDNQTVDEIFEFLKKQDKPIATAAYNALICGTAKFTKVDKAWTLFDECEKQGIELNLTTYNSLIQLISFLRDGNEERKSLMLELFGKIAKAGYKPNVGTLNAALKMISSITTQSFAKDLTRSLFTEFKAIGVEPCLASYYYALTIFCRDRGPRSTILSEILDELEKKELVMQDHFDTYFFVNAMEVARNHLQDRALGERIHKLLLTGKNYDFIGESFKESIYYRHYMMLMLKSLPFEEFMEIYDLLVPNIYIPEPSVMEEVLSAIELSDPSFSANIVPRLWSQIVMFSQLDRQVLVAKSFNLMRTFCTPPADSPMHTMFADAAWTYWNFLTDTKTTRTQPVQRTGSIIANMAILSLRGDQFERFLQVVGFMIKEMSSIIGTADAGQLNEMFEACLERGHVPGALDVLQYSVEAGFEEAATMGRKIQCNLPLTVGQESQLINLVGREVLKTKSSSNE